MWIDVDENLIRQVREVLIKHHREALRAGEMDTEEWTLAKQLEERLGALDDARKALDDARKAWDSMSEDDHNDLVRWYQETLIPDVEDIPADDILMYYNEIKARE